MLLRVAALVVLFLPYVVSAETRVFTAHFYYQSTGITDPRDLLSGGLALWNTIIGEGDARDPSDATFVLVEITVDKERPRPDSLRFEARADGRVLTQQTVDLGHFFEGTRIFVPSLSMRRVCEPLELAAFLVAESKWEPVKRTVPFRCGE